MSPKKKTIAKGFLSQRGNPTQNALNMFHLYLSSLPAGWDQHKLHKESIDKVKEYFKWTEETGFDVMIKWGINVSSARSKTSNKRYVAMSKAYHDAKGLIGKGYVWTDLPIQ